MKKKKNNKDVKVKIKKEKDQIDKDFFSDDDIDSGDKEVIVEKEEKFEASSDALIKTSSIRTVKFSRLNKNKDIYLETEDFLNENNLDTTFVDKTFFKNNNKLIEESEHRKSKKSIIVKVLLILLFICLTGYAFYSTYFLFIKPKVKIVTKEKIVKEEYVPENIVFLGDSISYRYPLDDFYDNKHLVNSGIDGNKTTDILKNMKDRVYDYNTSKVFLLIGVNDLNKRNPDVDDIFNNIKKIVSNIKENRNMTKIYIESVYPVNESLLDDDDNEVELRRNKNIISLNDKLKKYCDNNKITYINMYDQLVDEDGNLDGKYSDKGLHLSKEGYKVVTSNLKKYIEE